MNDRGGIPVCPSTRILTAKAKFCLTMFFHVMDPGNMVELIFKDVPQSEERELAFTGKLKWHATFTQGQTKRLPQLKGLQVLTKQELLS